MKRIVLLVLACLFSLTMVAQEKKSKNKKVVIKVAGNCGMCEKRIEKAAYSVKGVKNAEWHVDCQDIHLVIDETKCSADDVAKAIAAVGHDTGSIKAEDAVYDKLHGCCLYERMK
ncbi:heavy-metal-associated domain-containing protein [Flavobacterium lacisediminis]|uniref:Heavy-metal-associated domain-containing protein n=1 Tax=Flavobacterium lacisediminis TaxID=2989705 RepID=A0ABT3EFF7_9FLAO|nr:heavy-metal-associated domain-containing protein [Flavobacterium lacisediminis]MCW1147310.1 heavy-metal-associated domain-containing protein [Flavobacterium lacisediminis]